MIASSFCHSLGFGSFLCIQTNSVCECTSLRRENIIMEETQARSVFFLQQSGLLHDVFCIDSHTHLLVCSILH
uniref:Uncharacterized protein n=1 Tax=Anguilla anguilla TaxID=7936 RepID=A0A0E9WKD8_ANGAN